MPKILYKFLEEKLAMTEVYQPVIIKELLLNEGVCTKEKLASRLVEYDLNILKSYKGILMRWPKVTLEKHGIVKYSPKTKVFTLNKDLVNFNDIGREVALCDKRINNWLESRKIESSHSKKRQSLRIEVFKRARQKCELCGIPASLRYLDLDHIIPQSKARKGDKKVNLNLRFKDKAPCWVDVHSEENLQALCERCNRSKRDTDNTDFRRWNKVLIRDKVREEIENEGRVPIIKELKGNKLIKALEDKLIDKHSEFISEDKADEEFEHLAGMIEIIFSLAEIKNSSRKELLDLVDKQKMKKGGYERGYFYQGDEN
tara:strand:+ start:1709 stop:2653 length:945 start_codon:yes stop_codon:yes gene_type:complete